MSDSLRSWLLSWNTRWHMATYYQSLLEGRPTFAWQKDNKSRRLWYIAGAACCFVLLPLAYSVLFAQSSPVFREPPVLQTEYAAYHWGSDWNGWKAIDHMVVLGDSWSSTGFDFDGPQPSADNPLGNPSFPGATVTDGENWVDYLIYEYNKTAVLTADLAVGGATIDTALIKPGLPDQVLRSLKTQIGEFVDHYIDNPAFPWTANNSLFSIWVGVNDITAYTNTTRENFGKEFDVFAGLLDDLHRHGARNFLLFNAPPIDKSPLAATSDTVHEWPGMIEQWNHNFTALAQNFTQAYNESTIITFDAHTLFNDVLYDPCKFKETCGIVDTTTACIEYAFGAETPDFKHPNCQYSIDRYFWVNALHVSTQTHHMIAHAVSDALAAADDSFD